MQIVVMIVIALHALAAVLWMGTTMAMVRSKGLGAETLFRPQMAGATVSVLTGGYLWHLFHMGDTGPYGMILAGGATCALVAAAVQAVGVGSRLRQLQTADNPVAVQHKVGTAHRIAGGLLSLCLVCMVIARFA